MRAPLAQVELLRPRKLSEALRMMHEEECVPIAGCTDVFVELQFGLRKSPRYIDLSLLDELRGVRARHGILDIGATTTYTDLQHARDVLQRLPILAAAAREIGGVQIQNRGTIGGNVGNGSPAGDTLPVLAVAEAIVILRSSGGERRVPFNEFYTGYRQSVRRADELIVAIEIPQLPEGQQWFRKVGTRAAQAISKIVAAGIRAEPPRFALGSVAPTVIRLPRTEAALQQGLEPARAALAEEIAPIDDIRSSAAYRRKVAGNLLEQFWRAT